MMSLLLSLFSDVFHSEMFLMKGLLKKEAGKGFFVPKSNPSSGVVRQFFGLVISWAGLRYLYVEIDWRMVGYQSNLLTNSNSIGAY